MCFRYGLKDALQQRAMLLKLRKSVSETIFGDDEVQKLIDNEFPIRFQQLFTIFNPVLPVKPAPLRNEHPETWLSHCKYFIIKDYMLINFRH